MRKVIACLLAALLCSCGADQGAPSAGCTTPARVLDALKSAPKEVSVAGQPISHCFARDQTGSEVQALGSTLLSAAQTLRGRADGESDAALELGYLIGATRRGALRNAFSAELVRRLEAETDVARPNRAAYLRGLRAGLATG